jgi:hypothetical protein
MRISKVGRIFVGETEQRLPAPKNDNRRICALRHKVGEIDPCTVITYDQSLFRFVHLHSEVIKRTAQSSTMYYLKA